MVTHNLEHAIKMGNRLIMMHKGKIVMDIKGEENLQWLFHAYLINLNNFKGERFVDDRVMLA